MVLYEKNNNILVLHVDSSGDLYNRVHSFIKDRVLRILLIYRLFLYKLIFHSSNGFL